MTTQARGEGNNFAERDLPSEELERIGSAALDAHKSSGVKSFLNSESALNFEQDRRNDNLRQLEALGAPGYIANCYKRLTRDFPDLRNVKLRQEFSRSARDLHVTSNGDSAEHQLYFNFSDAEIYTSDTEKYEDNKYGAAYLEVGMGLGVDPADVAKNAQLCATFIFAREMGRAHDFERNFYEPQLQAVSKMIDDYGEASAVALNKALTSWSLARKNELSNRRRRNSPSNRRATEFALRYLIKNRHEFLYDMRSGEEANGRVQTLVNANIPIPIPDKLAKFASPEEGTMAILNSCDKDGNIEGLTAIRGRVDSLLSIGSPLMLNTSEDENPDHGATFMAVDNVSSVSFLPNRRSSGKYMNDLLLGIEDDDEFLLLQSNEQKVGYTELNYGDSRDYLSDINKRFGNKINLLRHAIKGASAAEHADSMAFSSDISKGLVLGEAVPLSPDKHMRIHSVMRKWRQYFIGTKNLDGSSAIYQIGDEKE